MSGKKLRVALIGAGGIGKRWVRSFSQIKEAVLVCVVDSDAGKAQALADLLPGCEVSADWKSTVKRADIDAVIIAVPHLLLSPISQEALRRGKHVLVEKPAAIHSFDIRKSIAIAKKQGARYMVGFNHRFHPAFILARKFWRQGKIGEIQFIRSVYGFGGRPGMAKEWRFKKNISGGGELIDQGVHMLDMARSFLGDIRDARGFAEALYWKTPVEDNAFVLLQSKKRQVASLHVSWSQWKPTHRFEIYGTTGYLVVEGLGRKYGGTEKLIWGKRSKNYIDPPREKEFVCDPDADQSLIREFQEFAGAIREGRDTVPSGADAYAALKIVEKIYS